MSQNRYDSQFQNRMAKRIFSFLFQLERDVGCDLVSSCPRSPYLSVPSAKRRWSEASVRSIDSSQPVVTNGSNMASSQKHFILPQLK